MSALKNSLLTLSQNKSNLSQQYTFALSIIAYTLRELFAKKIIWALVIILGLLLLLYGLYMGEKEFEYLSLSFTTEYELNTTSLGFIISFAFSRIYRVIMAFMLITGASLFPSLMEKGVAELFLSTPHSRMQLYIYRLLGLFCALGLIIISFFTIFWLLTYIKTGVSLIGIVSCSFFTIIDFWIIFSFATLVSIYYRNGTIAMIASFFILIFFTYLLHVFNVQYPALIKDTIWEYIVPSLYWIFPKVIIMEKIHSSIIKNNLIPINYLLELVTSSVFAIVFYVLAYFKFKKTEY